MLDFGPGSFFLSTSQLADSPSSRHGIPSSTEKTLRRYACEIIQEACILLRLSQAVSATAQVLLHRYFCKQSFRDFDARIVAASCFWLSMKLEEENGATYRKSKPSMLNDVVSMFEHIRARREGGVALPIHSPEFKRRKEEILKQEARVLSEFGFICNVEHPHKLLLGYLTCLGASKELVQESWNLDHLFQSLWHTKASINSVTLNPLWMFQKAFPSSQTDQNLIEIEVRAFLLQKYHLMFRFKQKRRDLQLFQDQVMDPPGISSI